MSSPERLLYSTAFLLTVSSQLVTPILPVYLHEVLKASKQEVGLIISLAAIASALSRIPSSFWGMRRNAIRMLIFSVTLNSIALFGYAVSIDPWMLAFFRILHGVSFALNYTLMLSLASLIVRPDRAHSSITAYTSSLAMGLWIGPAIGVMLSSMISLRLLMLSAALISLTAIISGILFLRTKPELWGDIYYSKAGIIETLESLLRRPIMIPTLIYLLYSTVIGALLAYGPLKAKIYFGIPDYLIILIFTIYYLIVFLLRTTLSRSAHGILNVRLLYLALSSCAIGILTAGLSQSTALFVVGVYLVAVAHGLTFPLTALIVAHIIPVSLRIIGNALYLTSWDIGNLLGPVLVALLLSLTNLSIALALISLSAVLALFLVGKIIRLIG